MNNITKLALMISCGLGLGSFAMNGGYELAEFCAQEQSDLDIHLLYQAGDLEAFRNAVEQLSVDINEPNQHGLSVAHLAAMNGQILWLALLYSLGADLGNPGGENEWPPIAWALYGQQLPAFRMLQNFGIKPVLPGFSSSLNTAAPL